MAQEKYGFFNSATGDARTYEADDLASAFRVVAHDGVQNVDACLRVSAEGGSMRTLVACGGAVVRGYHYELRDDGGAAIAFTHTAATGGSRIDRIALRLDLTARTIKLVKKAGAAAASPTAPALTRTGEAYELALADVYVREGATALTAADVTDCRGDASLCGLATNEGLLAMVNALMARTGASIGMGDGDGRTVHAAIDAAQSAASAAQGAANTAQGAANAAQSTANAANTNAATAQGAANAAQGAADAAQSSANAAQSAADTAQGTANATASKGGGDKTTFDSATGTKITTGLTNVTAATACARTLDGAKKCPIFAIAISGGDITVFAHSANGSTGTINFEWLATGTL